MASRRDNPEYNATLDAIYASFMAQKAHVAGRHDREVRNPQTLIELAAKLDLLPARERTIRITGSKGKGTTARMLAALLEREVKGPVGLLVSPEEIDHNDRIRVDGISPSREDFTQLYHALKPHLDEVQSGLSGHQYLSPFGIFLLMGLLHCKRAGVTHMVIECGRGAEFDEAGQIPSSIAVVTSIFEEHATYIGPTLSDIARNKLSIGHVSDAVICPQNVAAWNAKLAVVPAEKITLGNPIAAPDALLPQWLMANAGLASAAVAKLTGQQPANQPGLLAASAAFGLLNHQGLPVYFDASIHPQSFDRRLLAALKDRYPKLVVIASLPDDKDRAGVRALMAQEMGLDFYEIALSGTRGYLNYQQALREGQVLAEIHYEDAGELRRILQDVISNDRADSAYFLGTQTFIRLVKSAFVAEKA